MKDGRTHWDDCWKCHGHSDCAVEYVELWEARYRARIDELEKCLLFYVDLLDVATGSARLVQQDGGDKARQVLGLIEPGQLREAAG